MRAGWANSADGPVFGQEPRSIGIGGAGDYREVRENLAHRLDTDAPLLGKDSSYRMLGEVSGEASRLLRPEVHRTAASSALRRLVLAAAACDGAAGAAATAADEIAQLRAGVARAAAREDGRGGYPTTSFKANRLRAAAGDGESAPMRSAQARADAALQQSRRAQLALRHQASLDSLTKDKPALRDDDRREAAEALALASESKAELSAAKREMQAEAEVARRASDEAYGLGQRLRQAEAEANEFRKEADGLRVSEASTLLQMRGDIEKARRAATSEAHEAEDARKAQRDSARALADAKADAEAARRAKAAEASEAASLHRSLEASAAEAAASSASVKLELASEKEAARERLRSYEASEESSMKILAQGALKEHSSMALLARREEAARGLVASLLALRLEGLISGCFCAWRDAMDHEVLSGELEAQRKDVACLRTSLSTMAGELADARRAAGEARMAASSAESEARERAEAARADAEAAKAGAASRCALAALQRHQLAMHGVLASLMAERTELLVRGAFCAWRDAGLGDAERGEAAEQAAKLERVEREREQERARWESQLSETADDAQGLREELEKAVAEAKEAARLRAELGKLESEAHDSEALRADLEVLSDEAAEAERLRAELEKAGPQLQEAERLRAELAKAEAGLQKAEEEARKLSSGAASAALLRRREEIARGVLSTLLATQMETQLRGAFAAWRASAEATDASDQVAGRDEVEVGRLREELDASKLAEATAREAILAAREEGCLALGRLEKEAEGDRELVLSAATAEQAAVAEASKLREALATAEASKAAELAPWALCERLMSRREAATRSMLASLITERLELLLLGVLSAWRAASTSPGPEALAKEPSAAPVAEPPQDSSAAVDKLALLRHAQACQAVLSAVLAGQLELALRGAFSVWRAATGVALAADAPSAPEPAAKADTVAEAVAVAAMERHCQACHRVLSAALSRQLELCVRVALHAWRTVAQAGPVEAEPGRPPVAEVASAALVRREQAATAVVANLMAAQLEMAVCGAFCAWRAACEAPDEEAAAKSAATLQAGQEEIARLREELEDRGDDVERCKREAAEWQRRLAPLEEEVKHLRQTAAKHLREQEALARASSTEADAKAAAESAERKAAEAEAKVAALVAARAQGEIRERAARGVLSSLLASNMELVLHGAFSCWAEFVEDAVAKKVPEFKALDPVVVVEAMQSNSKTKVQLLVGQAGKIIRIDEDGDALIDFKDHPQSQWVCKANLTKLSLAPSATTPGSPTKASAVVANQRAAAAEAAVAKVEADNLRLSQELNQASSKQEAEIKALQLAKEAAEDKAKAREEELKAARAAQSDAVRQLLKVEQESREASRSPSKSRPITPSGSLQPITPSGSLSGSEDLLGMQRSPSKGAALPQAELIKAHEARRAAEAEVAKLKEELKAARAANQGVIPAARTP